VSGNGKSDFDFLDEDRETKNDDLNWGNSPQSLTQADQGEGHEDNDPLPADLIPLEYMEYRLMSPKRKAGDVQKSGDINSSHACRTGE
jgi:hypothetical protein